jgi:hypothetical protein
MKNMKRKDAMIITGILLVILIIITSVFTLLSVFVYNTWEYALSVLYYGLLTELFMIAVAFIPVGGIILGVFYILTWSDGLLVFLVLPYSWMTGLILWSYVIIGFVVNIIVVIHLIKTIIKR